MPIPKQDALRLIAQIFQDDPDLRRELAANKLTLSTRPSEHHPGEVYLQVTSDDRKLGFFEKWVDRFVIGSGLNEQTLFNTQNFNTTLLTIKIRDTAFEMGIDLAEKDLLFAENRGFNAEMN